MFGNCSVCKANVDLHHAENFYQCNDETICASCARFYAIQHDASINPIPQHMRSVVEPYIRFREDMAIAKFVLEQTQNINHLMR